jgi:hypothetical protein
MRLLIRSVSTALVLVSFAGAARAQFTEYTTPGGPDGRPIDRKGALQAEAEAARLRLGPVRLAPTLALKDVAYVKNLLGAEGSAMPTDFTATVRAGFRAYLPNGAKTMWTAYGLPEYVWWDKETDRRRFDGLYGAGFDGFWNHLTLQVSAGSDAQQQILTAEVPTLTSARVNHAGTSAELGVTAAFSLFASGSLTQQRSLVNPKDPLTVQLAELDHNEQVERGEVRWRPGGGWMVGAGAEHSDVAFTDHGPGSINRGNSGTAPVLEVLREHGRLFVQADVAQRSLNATQGSSFVKFDKTTGHFTVSYEITTTVELFAYLNRNLVYSVVPGYSYFDDLRHGGSLHVKLGHRSRVSVFGETGSLGYTVISGEAPERRDDLVAWGGALSFDVTRGAVVALTGSSTRFTSDIPGAGRSINTLGITFTLAAGQPASAVAP